MNEGEELTKNFIGQLINFGLPHIGQLDPSLFGDVFANASLPAKHFDHAQYRYGFGDVLDTSIGLFHHQRGRSARETQMIGDEPLSSSLFVHYA
jgi:hypothetical protein